MSGLNVAICHQSLLWGDAIGHDAVGMYRLLESFGEDPVMACEADRGLPPDVAVKRIHDLNPESLDLVIFHHSQYWAEGERFLDATTCPILLRYHNITPAHFFAPYNPIYAAVCAEGRRMTKRLLDSDKTTLWTADSAYNKQDLIEAGADPEKIRVAPPFNRLAALITQKNEANYNSDLIDFLFVGRLAPNKGHLHLFKILRSFLDLGGRNARLRLVGEIHPELSTYHAELMKGVESLGLQAHVEFVQHSSDEDLGRLFRTAHIYPCFSEHEGFCVPVVEAQIIGLPVVAAAVAAVGETLGPEQFVAEPPLSPGDYSFYAALCHRLVSDDEVRNELILQGERNARTRFTGEAIENAFTGALYDILHAS